MKTQRARTSLITLLALPVLMTQVARADYQSTVLADGPKAYYRLNDDTTRNLINKNSGSLGAAANATNDLVGAGNLHPFPGAIVGDGNRSVFFDSTTRTEIPFNEALNPPNTQPFTIEAWLYPASDLTSNGQSPLANRWTLTGDRQGWVFFQRKPDSSYNGGEPVGWNFRMFNGFGTSGRLDVTSLVPYQIGKWQHVVVIYDPVEVTNATLTMYIDGMAANTNIWPGTNTPTGEVAPGYMPITSNLDPQPAISLGAYNNANAVLNYFYGGVDEFALYTNKLSAAQILSHYQNATNANRAQSYDSLIKSHNPAAYLRLDEIAPSPTLAVNLGDTRNAGIATHTAEVRYPATSALTGRTKDGSAAYHRRNGFSVTTVPFLEANNPNAGVPFTFEAWLRPMMDTQGGQCPVNNRWVGGSGRTGWVIFQRNPNKTYPVSEGYGWNFRLFSGAGTSGQDVLTGGGSQLPPEDPAYNVGDYQIGKWQHLVVTWEPQVDNGMVGDDALNNQWQGILTAYVDGVAVASNTAALYAANRAVTETGTPAADLAVGAYNAASTLGNNPYEGDMDEVAIYTGFVLTADQIMAHYQAGTNANYGTNYETLVMTDGLTIQPVPGQERNGHPRTYLRFTDPAHWPAANSGTLGYVADGNQVLTTNIVAGPQPPAYAGFEASNTAVPLDSVKQWASFNNPSGLNFAGLITLEAWVRPETAQTNDPAIILSHGPQTPSSFLGLGYDKSVTNTSQVFLAIEAAGANYVVGSREVIDGSAPTTYSASFAIPAGDLGGTNWIHLVGTYDGTNWNLYRNGAQVATAAAAVGALPVDIGDWAIGSTGNGWANNFAGGIDEVAIYDTALTPAQVAAHYGSGQGGGPAVLTITPAGGGNVTITWPAGTTLLQSALVTGPYTNTPGNPVSPLTVPAIGTQFYRSSMP